MRQRISAVPLRIFARFSPLGSEIIWPEQDSLNIKTLQFTFCLRSILQRHLANAVTTPSTVRHAAADVGGGSIS